MTRVRRQSAVVVALVALVAGCSDDDGGGSGADAEVDTEEVAAELTAAEGVDCVNLPDCAVQVTRTDGLSDGDVISIRIEGWEPDTSVGIAQCADPEDADNQDIAPQPDGLLPGEVCNVLGLNSAAQSERSDADGVVAFDYEVRAGETMARESAEGECDAQHDCRLSLFWNSDLRLRSDAQRVSIPLTFS